MPAAPAASPVSVTPIRIPGKPSCEARSRPTGDEPATHPERPAATEPARPATVEPARSSADSVSMAAKPARKPADRPGVTTMPASGRRPRSGPARGAGRDRPAPSSGTGRSPSTGVSARWRAAVHLASAVPSACPPCRPGLHGQVVAPVGRNCDDPRHGTAGRDRAGRQARSGRRPSLADAGPRSPFENGVCRARMPCRASCTAWPACVPGTETERLPGREPRPSGEEARRIARP